jgi:aerobic C4-dicarboxylate transport protein
MPNPRGNNVQHRRHTAACRAPSGAEEEAILAGLGFQIILAAVLSAAVRFLFPSVAVQLKILGDIFLLLIKTAVAPLVFLCVAVGIVSAGAFKRIGKVGLVAMLYFEVLSSFALAVGLLGGNLLGVGHGIRWLRVLPLS